MIKTNNRKRNIRIAVLVLTICMILINVLAIIPSFAVTPASGQAAFEITNFKYEAVVTKKHEYNVTEIITVNLTDDLTNLEFVIPNGKYKMSDLKVDGIPIYRADKTVKIESPEKLSKGHHTYTIEYIIKEYIDRDETKDILYFDILPPGWMQSITNLDISVQMPDDFPMESITYYAGQYGVQNVNTKLDFNVNEPGRTVTITGKRIPENFGITLKSTLEDGYWQGVLDGTLARTIMVLIMFLVMAGLAVMWYFGGRDPIVEKVMQAHPVDGVSPAEVSYVINGRVRTRDVVSLIVYFGIRGYLKIVEYEPKKYRLIRVNDPGTEDEEKYIRTAFELLFEDIPKDRWIDTDDMGPRLRKIKESIKEDIASGFSSKEMASFTPLSRIFRTAGIALKAAAVAVCSVLKYSSLYESPNFIEAVIVAGIIAVLLHYVSEAYDDQDLSDDDKLSPRFIIPAAGYVVVTIYSAVRTFTLTHQLTPTVLLAVFMIVSAFFVLIMRARAEGNAELANKFMQLRHFIYHPDARAMLESFMADRAYYYEIVPYALTFNGLESWAISFLTLNVPDPDWFEEDIEGNAFTNLNKEEKVVVDYARDIKAFARTIEIVCNSMDRQGRIRWQIDKK